MSTKYTIDGTVVRCWIFHLRRDGWKSSQKARENCWSVDLDEGGYQRVNKLNKSTWKRLKPGNWMISSQQRSVVQGGCFPDRLLFVVLHHNSRCFHHQASLIDCVQRLSSWHRRNYNTHLGRLCWMSSKRPGSHESSGRTVLDMMTLSASGSIQSLWVQDQTHNLASASLVHPGGALQYNTVRPLDLCP